jgi:hypothetical protein
VKVSFDNYVINESLLTTFHFFGFGFVIFIYLIILRVFFYINGSMGFCFLGVLGVV